MDGLGDFLTRFIIPLSGAVLGWIAVHMSKRGANRAKIEQTRADELREDQIQKGLAEERRAEASQRMADMQVVLDRFASENTRLSAEAVALRQARDVAEARADEMVERVRSDWEQRWHRQMERCRQITEPLVAAIARLSRTSTDEAARVEAQLATNRLEDHNAEDHTEGDDL